MCRCQGMQQWGGTCRQCGICDMACVGQFSEQNRATRNLDGPVKRLQSRQNAVQLTQTLLENFRLMGQSLRHSETKRRVKRIKLKSKYHCIYSKIPETGENCWISFRQVSLTSIDLQTPATAWHAAEVGKSMGRLGSPRIDTNGRSPFWLTNS